MTATKVKKASYRDDPDAVSLHTTPGEAAYTDDVPDLAANSSSAPPSYDEVNQYTDPDDDEFEGLRGLNDPNHHFTTISSSSSVFQKGKKSRIAGEHVSVQHPCADIDPAYLQHWIEYMSRQTPTPYIVLTGTHSECRREADGKQKREEVTDFHIRINLRNYLWPNFRLNDPTMMELQTVNNNEKVWRGTVFKQCAPSANGDFEVGEVKPSLQQWCHRYCASASKTRIFRLTRTVVGLDELHLTTRLTGLIQSTNYKGKLSISFPVADRAVNIYSTSLLNKWRLTTWICWIFYLTFLWIFSWPILYFTTKRYNVVRAEWSFSKTDAHGNRKFTTVSEEQWLDKFGPAVKQLALDRYCGIVGDDMLNQVLTRPETHRPAPAVFRNAQAIGDAMIGGVRAGFDPVNHATNLLRFAGGSNDQVGWGYDT